MSSRYSRYQKLTFEHPSPKVLEIVLHGVGRANACDKRGHYEMSEIWKDVAEDPEVHCAIVRGPGDAFCAGGHMDLVDNLGQDFELMLQGWTEARGIVYNMLNCSKPIISAILWSGGRCRPRNGDARGHHHCFQDRAHQRRPRETRDGGG